MLFLKLFLTFIQIGVFGFGGGYAMLSLIYGEVVSGHQWLSSGQFADIVAISQMTPGPIGINSATYVGYTSLQTATGDAIMGILGSLVATMAVVLPSFVLMLVISRYFLRYKNHPVVEMVFKGLRPAVVGLLAAAALLLMNAENFGTPTVSPWQFGISVFLFLSAFIGTVWFKINPIRMILLSALAGLLLL